MTPAPQPQGKLIYSSAPWKIYEQDAGMGERDYAVMVDDVFYCRTDDSQTALKIVEAIRSRPASSPEEKPCDHCDFQERDERESDIARQAAAQARNATLDKAISLIREREINSENPKGWLWRNEWLVALLESLRGEL